MHDEGRRNLSSFTSFHAHEAAASDGSSACHIPKAVYKPSGRIVGREGGGVVTVNKKKLFSQKKNGDSCWSIRIRHYVWSVNWGTSWDLIFTQMPSTYLNQRLGGVPLWPTPSPQIECPGKQKSVISRRPWANVVIWSVKIKPLCYIIVYTIYCKLLDLSKVQAV